MKWEDESRHKMAKLDEELETDGIAKLVPNKEMKRKLPLRVMT